MLLYGAHSTVERRVFLPSAALREFPFQLLLNRRRALTRTAIPGIDGSINPLNIRQPEDRFTDGHEGWMTTGGGGEIWGGAYGWEIRRGRGKRKYVLGCHRNKGRFLGRKMAKTMPDKCIGNHTSQSACMYGCLSICLSV